MGDESKLNNLPAPFVFIDGLHNVRDIGGWPIFAGETDRTIGHIRSGLLFRGPDIARITDAGAARLKELGIVTHFDLRSQQQLDRMGTGREIEGITRHWTPVFGEAEYTIEKAGVRYQQYAGDGTEGIVEAFKEILTHGATAFKEIMAHIASLPPPAATQLESSSHGVYINCTTGNNRTGPFVATLLTFLGVPSSIVAREYGLSQQGLEPSRASTIARLRSNSKFAASFSADELDYRASRMAGAREESMSDFLKVLEIDYAGAEGYFRNVLSLNDEVLEKVKKVMIVPDIDGSKERERRNSILSSPVSPTDLSQALRSMA